MERPLIAFDLSAAMPGSPVRVERHYIADSTNGDLLVRFILQNTQTHALELGAFGMSMVFDQLFTGRTLDTIAESCSFNDPYIGMGAGYIQVVRTTGTGAVMLVLPDHDGAGAGFENWRLLREDPTPRSVTFEGWYEALVYSKAWAENEWKDAGMRWNEGSSLLMQPGSTHNITFRFTPAASVRGDDVQAALSARGIPTATAVPGYILTPAMGTAVGEDGAESIGPVLHLESFSAVQSMRVTPESAIQFTPLVPSTTVPPAADGSKEEGSVSTSIHSSYAVHVPSASAGVGPVQLLVTYADGLVQTISYYVHPDSREQAARYASALSEDYWYNVTGDAFDRAPSFMNWDTRLTPPTGLSSGSTSGDSGSGDSGSSGGQVSTDEASEGSWILQDHHAWVSGISDECGASPAVGMAIKNMLDPDQRQVLVCVCCKHE
jgi:hypothetical protein